MAPDGAALDDHEARRALYGLLDEGLTRRAVMDRVLEIGAQYLQIDHGHIVDIDPETNRWEVTRSTDAPDGPYPMGLREDLDTTYCRRTIRRAEPIALHDAKRQGWGDDPAYRRHELETYLGIRIETDGKPYGTLCFVADSRRGEPFTEAERIFVEIAAVVIGRSLDRTQHRLEIVNRDRVIEVLNRVLRHNLRNDLNVVVGYADLLRDDVSREAAAHVESIIDASNELLNLADKARTLDEMTDPVPVSRPMDVVPLVEETVRDFRAENPDVDLDVAVPERALTIAAPQLSEALRELLDNVARHTGDAPAATVTVRTDPETTTITVEDDGDGLPADERRVLVSGDETPLEHGSGLGLFLVFWTVTMIDGTIAVDVTPTGTEIDLELNRPAAVRSPSRRED